MSRIYKTVRIDDKTKFMIDKLISKYDNELGKNIKDLISKYEEELLLLEDFKNLSPQLTVKISVSGIVEHAVKYFKIAEIPKEDIIKINYSNEDINKSSKNIKSNTLKLYLLDTTFDFIDDTKLFLSNILNARLTTLKTIKIIISIYYKKEFNID